MLGESWNDTEVKIQSTPVSPGEVASQLDSVSCTSLICTATVDLRNTEGIFTLVEATP
jgi:hypothetical protein